jgi:hypothetical protein
MRDVRGPSLVPERAINRAFVHPLYRANGLARADDGPGVKGQFWWRRDVRQY